MTRRRLVAAATTILALLLQAPPVRAADPLPPAPGLTLRLADRGNGGAQYEWLDAEGRVYDLGPERWINEPVAPVPGIAVPVALSSGCRGNPYPGGERAYALVDVYAAHYGAPGIACSAKKVLDQESHGLNVPNATGSGASGPMQFIRSTFNAHKAAAGFPGADLWDYEANVATGVYLMSRGGWGHWGGRPA